MAAPRLTLLQLVIVGLELWDAAYSQLLSSWCWLTGRRGLPRAAGSRPAPPRVVGVILAEPHSADISLHKVARVAAWCLPYGVQQLHLYDPAGHLKQSQAVLQDNLEEAAAQEGRTLLFKCGWSVSRPALCAPWHPWEQQQQQGQRQQPGAAGQQGGRRQQQRTWSAWLAQQFTLAPHQQQQHQQHQQALAAKQQCQGECQGNGACASLQARAAAEPGAACNGTAAAGPSSSSSGSSGGSNSDSSSSSVTIRLLSAEDAWRPVIDAALQRSSRLGGTSPRALWPGSLRQLPQQQQQQLQVCGLGGCCASQAATQPGSDGTKQQQQQDCPKHSGQQQQPQQQQLVAGCGKEQQADGTVDPDRQQQACQHQVAQQQQQQQQQEQKPAGEDQGRRCCECECRQQQVPPPPLLLPPRSQQQETRQQQQQQQHRTQQQQQQQQQRCVLPELLEVAEAAVADEPQLLLVFGPAASLAGYPPWLARAAEVHHLGSLAAAGRQQVADAVARYCNVLQRHGA